MRLPGLIDVHVHAREPGACHKEDWDTCTAAALAGGFTAVLGMPNTRPAVTDEASLALALGACQARSRCDYGHFLGATADNAEVAARLAPRVAGLKMYLCHTFGPLLLDDATAWDAHFERWPGDRPIAVHAEGEVLRAVLALARRHHKPLHVCHLPTWRDLRLVMQARDAGAPVTCEVTPHHLLLDQTDAARLGPGRCEVRPRLATPEDRAALWAHLDEIDCFATDHAPHTAQEKDGPQPPPGFPLLEEALVLLLTEVHRGRLSLAQLTARLSDNPRSIFHIAPQEDTWVEIDPEPRWTLPARPRHTRAGWTPFAGREVRGRVERVVLRGATAFEHGRVLASPGSARAVARSEEQA